jgi:hypothetical protein
MLPRKILVAYYAATALFLSLDYGFGVNVRIAFLESAPGLKTLYYFVCFACLALVLWRPALTTFVGMIESLATLVALIINMALRSMIVTDAMLESGMGFVTMPEIINFVIAGGAAYVSYLQGVRSIANR